MNHTRRVFHIQSGTIICAQPGRGGAAKRIHNIIRKATEFSDSDSRSLSVHTSTRSTRAVQYTAKKRCAWISRGICFQGLALGCAPRRCLLSKRPRTTRRDDVAVRDESHKALSYTISVEAFMLVPTFQNGWLRERDVRQVEIDAAEGHKHRVRRHHLHFSARYPPSPTPHLGKLAALPWICF